MTDLPGGTVSLLFTDIEGSTRLLQELGRERYVEALEAHRRLLRNAFQRHGGVEVEMQGDSFFFAFASAHDAVVAAKEAQSALASHRWPSEPILVRIGIHTGEPVAVGGLYSGLDVHRAARVMAAGHGGQVLVSQTTRELLDGDVVLRDLGEHRLKDLLAPVRLYQVGDLDFPPLKSLNQTNLPVQLTPLIGRERELDDLRALLGRDTVRLVTLTGPGGTGKTRLALQLAAEVSPRFQDGVFFVALAPVTDPDLLIATIAQTLRIRDQAGVSQLEALNAHLREKRMLLLLDNVEQIVSAAPAVASLLASAQGLRVIATSRAPLHLSGERIYDVPPLALPDLKRLPKLEDLSRLEAAALFIERAQAANAGFTLANDNARSVAEICVRLDGLPLAIELAAARVRALPPQTLLARFDQRLKLLTGGARDLDERQRTLQATIEWSYELLPNREKELFAQLAVFVGGCRLEAAQAVCGSEDDPLDLLDRLTSLAEKSLLRPKIDRDGEPRYWMLETIREFAYDRFCQSASADAVRVRHAEHFRQLSEEAAGQFHGGAGSAWFARLENDQGNLRLALEFWRREPDVQLVIAAAIWPLWWLQGYWGESRRWLDEALTASTDASPRRLKALEGAYYLAYLQGDNARARRLLDETLVLARRLEDREGIAYALHGLGNLAASEGDRERWRTLEEESLEFSAGLRHELYPLSSLGWFAFAYEDDYPKSRSLLERAVAVGRRFGDDTEVARELARLATVAAFNGDTDDALTMLRESVELGQTVGANAILAQNCLLGSAALRSVRGDPEGALRLVGASETLTAEMGVSQRGGPVSEEIKRRVVQAAERNLDEDSIASSMETGRSFALHQALAEALADQTASAFGSSP